MLNQKKDDIGEEMYFIIEGTVNILTIDESGIIISLSKGNYFGEIALFSENAKRICSVVSATFCQLFILRKENLSLISSKFPKMEEIFKKES